MTFFYKWCISFFSTTIITSILMGIFSIYFFIEYSQEMQKRMQGNIEEYGEIDLHHLCNINTCKAIYFNNKYYGIDPTNQMISLQYTENVIIPKELFSNGNISLRADLSFVIFMWSEGYSEPAYFFLDTDTFIKKFIFLYVMLLIILNLGVFITLKVVTKKEKTMHDIESANDKTMLQFNNLMFYIENLNHEVNSPLFILSRKIKDLSKKIKNEEKTFEIISNSIEQISAVMQRTREVKRINKSSEDRTIYDLIESTILTVSVMRSENIVNEIKKEGLDDYYLDQKLLTNGTFINILTNHVKNSIEAYATTLTTQFIKVSKGKLIFLFSDDGNGIDPIYRKKVFEKGFSTKGKTDRGSGLSINKDIIESVGGHIKLVDSKYGTTFEITIPVKGRNM